MYNHGMSEKFEFMYIPLLEQKHTQSERQRVLGGRKFAI